MTSIQLCAIACPNPIPEDTVSQCWLRAFSPNAYVFGPGLLPQSLLRGDLPSSKTSILERREQRHTQPSAGHTTGKFLGLVIALWQAVVTSPPNHERVSLGLKHYTRSARTNPRAPASGTREGEKTPLCVGSGHSRACLRLSPSSSVSCAPLVRGEAPTPDPARTFPRGGGLCLSTQGAALNGPRGQRWAPLLQPAPSSAGEQAWRGQPARHWLQAVAGRCSQATA